MSTITVKYTSVDGAQMKRSFKTKAGARKFAAKYVGERPEIGRGYAVSSDGVGKVVVDGLTLHELFEQPMTEQQAIILAAAFGRSNMGMGMPPVADVQSLMRFGRCTLSGATLRFCEQFMETDEHQSMFEEEARSFYDDFKTKPLSYVTDTWTDEAVRRVVEAVTPAVSAQCAAPGLVSKRS